MNKSPEFQEISHCGGQVIFKVRTDANGQRGYQITSKAAALFRWRSILSTHCHKEFPSPICQWAGLDRPGQSPQFRGVYQSL